MSKTIFYFSGTGNSLKTAKDIADGIEDVDLVSMSMAIDDNLVCNSDVVGFVFPIYFFGIPNRVFRFINQLKIKKDAYLFAVLTYGSYSGNGLASVDSLLKKKGSHLSYGATLKMVDNYILLLKIKEDTAKKTLAKSKVALKPIIRDIKNMRENKIKGINPLVDYINQRYHVTFANKDTYFTVSDQCTHCGVCVHVCPAHNIDLIDGRPIYNHRCEQCLACLHWCPVEAINWKGKTEHKKRYHHPAITYKQLP